MLASLALPLRTPLLRRSLASTVLLNRSWETETVAQLKSETRARGLSSSGNKAALIQRLKDFEVKQVQSPPASTRPASTAAATTAPPDVNIFNIHIPDLSQPAPEGQVQVPYVPDFWDSSLNAIDPAPENAAPKLLVVAGATTHHGGGPSHNLLLDNQEPILEEPTPKPAAAPASTSGGLFYDLAEDLGFLTHVPAPKPVNKTPFWQLFG
ncbi:hypothetical protein EST38_g4968 [Candolleomyces aberdarensis]|uniref:SAP domain-containing protein n=1 Tax=Candolleomyces aberdarensis TaxID=2316362 RepID=A0A4Q2DLP9_9AGAR|nr:hypothetical protein EST38_g4968 [Candolleomyces aberdarensis]